MSERSGPAILIVKLSSLGDVVHTMPAVQDIRAAHPKATIDWVVEKSFSALVRRCAGVDRVIECEIRRWRRAPLSGATRAAWQTFRGELAAREYDAVIDLQGLSKSALVAWLARLTPGGARHALGNRTDGSSWEAPTRWLAHRAHRIEPHVHAVRRSRLLAAAALGHELPTHAARFGLAASPGGAVMAPTVAIVHGSSRADKCWSPGSWIALGARLADAGLRVALVQGSEAEERVAASVAAGINTHAPGSAAVWPRLGVGELVDRMASCAGVIGVDSGPSHIAMGLNLPQVQIYNFDTAWRTGPQGVAHQTAVFAPGGPAVEAVWQAWHQVSAAATAGQGAA